MDGLRSGGVSSRVPIAPCYKARCLPKRRKQIPHRRKPINPDELKGESTIADEDLCAQLWKIIDEECNSAFKSIRARSFRGSLKSAAWEGRAVGVENLIVEMRNAAVQLRKTNSEKQSWPRRLAGRAFSAGGAVRSAENLVTARAFQCKLPGRAPTRDL